MRSGVQLLSTNGFENFDLKILQKNSLVFVGSFHNFGWSYSEKMTIFSIRCISMWFHAQLAETILDGI